MLHSFVGLAAVLVGYNSFFEPGDANEGSLAAIHAAEVFLGVFIGAVTFTGSIVAFLKLSAKMKSSPLVLPQRHKLNAAILLVSAGLMAWFMSDHSDGAIVPLGIMTLLALFLGFHLGFALEVEADTAHVGFVQDIGRDDLHHHREAGRFRHCGSFLGGLRLAAVDDGDAVCFQ